MLIFIKSLREAFCFLSWIVASFVFVKIVEVTVLEPSSIADWVIAFATMALAAIAFIQIRAFKENHIQKITLEACNKYDTEAVIDKSHRTIRSALEFKRSVDQVDLFESCMTLFNFFDAIGIGLKQKVYDETIVKEHLFEVISNHVDLIAASEHELIKEFRDSMDECFPSIMSYYRKWKG